MEEEREIVKRVVRGHTVEIRPLLPMNYFRGPFAIYIDGVKASSTIEYENEVMGFLEVLERDHISPCCICGRRMGWAHGSTVLSSDEMGERYSSASWECPSLRKHNPKVDPLCVFALMHKGEYIPVKFG